MIYLGATRVATAFLAGGFIWMHSISRQLAIFDMDIRLLKAPMLVPLCSDCVLHQRRSLAVSHLAPMRSSCCTSYGIGIDERFYDQIALYGIIRILVIGGLNSELLANLIFGLGLISAFWGVLFALVQSDLKRLLAYSSIEKCWFDSFSGRRKSEGEIG